jgi:hypothetical protein
MYKALPCSDYYGGSVAMPDIQVLHHSLYRLSGLGNPRLGLLDVACCDVGWGFRPFPLIAVGRHEYGATDHFILSAAVTHGFTTILRRWLSLCPLGLPIKQYSFHPYSQLFILPFSRG